jgi:hypothetical protein
VRCGTGDSESQPRTHPIENPMVAGDAGRARRRQALSPSTGNGAHGTQQPSARHFCQPKSGSETCGRPRVFRRDIRKRSRRGSLRDWAPATRPLQRSFAADAEPGPDIFHETNGGRIPRVAGAPSPSTAIAPSRIAAQGQGPPRGPKTVIFTCC